MKDHEYFFQDYTYEYFTRKSTYTIFIKKTLTSIELYKLKYISDNSDIIVQYENIEDYFKILKRFKNLNKKNKVILKVWDKSNFNEALRSNDYDYDNAYVNLLEPYYVNVSLKEYVRLERKLYSMVEPIKNLSPFEKYVYIYNLVKNFKEYKENENDLTSARDLYKILENNYIVCVGYKALFMDLLSRVGINAIEDNVKVDISYDDIEDNLADVPKKEIVTSGEEHTRVRSYIKDSKYNIDGIYISDPTWDNDLENDFYNHLIMTDKEVRRGKRYLYLEKNSYDELFNVDSIEDFYNKLNYSLDKNDNGKDINLYIKNFLNWKLGKLDPEFLKSLKNRYPYLKHDTYLWPFDKSDLIYDIAYYITLHVNKEISAKTITNAVKYLYQNVYNYDLNKIAEVKEENKLRQEEAFPKRYKIYKDGKIEIYENEFNKFDDDVKKL